MYIRRLKTDVDYSDRIQELIPVAKVSKDGRTDIA
jgi:hypothetical protein